MSWSTRLRAFVCVPTQPPISTTPLSYTHQDFFATLMTPSLLVKTLARTQNLVIRGKPSFNWFSPRPDHNSPILLQFFPLDHPQLFPRTVLHNSSWRYFSLDMMSMWWSSMPLSFCTSLRNSTLSSAHALFDSPHMSISLCVIPCSMDSFLILIAFLTRSS